jgi:hypothetical protein
MREIVEDAVKLTWQDSRLVPVGSLHDVRAEPLAEHHLLLKPLWSQPTNVLSLPAKIVRSSILSLKVSFENDHPATISKVQLILGAIVAQMREFGKNYKVTCLSTRLIV